MPTYVDSVDKIVKSYFAILSTQPFTYKSEVYEPKPVAISPSLLRGFTCPEGCGGCCPRFSLDYLPSEDRPPEAKSRHVLFNGQSIKIYSDLQSDHRNHHCRNLNKENGRCGIYTCRPFSCDFELIRTLTFESVDRPNMLTQRLFGRGWALLRIDNERGALCDMTPTTEESTKEVIRKLKRLDQWATHFNLKTHTKDIIGLIKRGELTEKRILYP